MSSLNSVQIIGRLGKDPVVAATKTGAQVCKVTVATSEKRKNTAGEYVETTEWHNVVCFGKTAEIMAKYLKKGHQAFFEGRFQTQKYQGKDGTDKYMTQIIASKMIMLGSKKANPAAEGQPIAQTPQPQSSQQIIDDIPF